MENLYAIRGWVEGDSQVLDGVRAAVAPTAFASHWFFSSSSVGQHGFAFFGAVVRDGELDPVRSQLQQIASEVETDFSDIRQKASGYFQVTCLSGGEPPRVWRFASGVFTEEEHDRAA